jgi:release factor glutamine methyltransferase
MQIISTSTPNKKFSIASTLTQPPIQLDIAYDPHVTLAPDSMSVELASLMAKWLNISNGKTILDLGCGSGVLAAGAVLNMVDLEDVVITLVDHNAGALAWAKYNVEAALHARGARDGTHTIRTHLTNWLDQELSEGNRYDAVMMNPPYAFEGQVFRNPQPEAHLAPRTAMYAGVDGLDAYREVFPLLAAVLAPNGKAFIRMPRLQARFDQAVAILREVQPEVRIARHNLGSDIKGNRVRHYGRAIAIQANSQP